MNFENGRWQELDQQTKVAAERIASIMLNEVDLLRPKLGEQNARYAVTNSFSQAAFDPNGSPHRSPAASDLLGQEENYTNGFGEILRSQFDQDKRQFLSETQNITQAQALLNAEMVLAMQDFALTLPPLSGVSRPSAEWNYSPSDRQYQQYRLQQNQQIFRERQTHGVRPADQNAAAPEQEPPLAPQRSSTLWPRRAVGAIGQD